MAKVTMTIRLTADDVKAEAFNIIARYVHKTYDGMEIANISPDEAFFVTVVSTTEQMLEAFPPSEGNA